MHKIHWQTSWDWNPTKDRATLTLTIKSDKKYPIRLRFKNALFLLIGTLTKVKDKANTGEKTGTEKISVFYGNSRSKL